MKIKKLYPNGAEKAFVISYDDGIEQDVRFVDLLNAYGLKGTFNLNSQLCREEFVWKHDCGMYIKRLSAQTVSRLYNGHEVASHTLTHPYLQQLSEEEIFFQMSRDKEELQRICDCEVCGFAVPFDYIDERVAICAQKCGFEYVRLPTESRLFNTDYDFFHWKPTIFHLQRDLEGCFNQFENTSQELALFQLVGHSYDLDVENAWKTVENLFARVADNSHMVSLKTIEAVRYITAMRKFSVKNNVLTNESDLELWFDVNGDKISLKPNETRKLF